MRKKPIVKISSFVLRFLLTVIVGCMLYTKIVYAEDLICGDYTYVIMEDGTAKITSYTGSSENILVPERLDGVPVTSIGSCTFYEKTSIKSINLPSSVTSIEWRAFYLCSNLLNIEIPSGVTSIEVEAFARCSSLTAIEIPFGVTTIEDSLFSGCSSLTSIDIPASVTNIKGYAFNGCSSLTYIEIPYNVTSIGGGGVFSGCSSLTTIKIPSGVTTIGPYTFDGCSSLTSIEIPSGVTSIGDYAFGDCGNLTNINIPPGVTSIGKDAFSGCKNMTDIKIPSGVTSIEAAAFIGCSSLTNIEIPSGVTAIGESAFSGCNSLTNIEIPSGVMAIENYTFKGCSSLTNIEIPSNVTSIGAEAFSGCSSLTDIKIPSGVTSIRDETFSGCSSLTYIVVPSNVTCIGWRTFYDCSSLVGIEIPSGVTAIGKSAFSECSSLTSIEIPSDLTIIEDGTFSYCSSLTSIEIPSGVIRIGKKVFENCSMLSDIYYLGSQTEWKNINGVNYVMSSITVHYNSENPNTPKYKSTHYADAGGIWNDYTYWNIKTNQETNDIKLSIFGRGEMPEELPFTVDPLTGNELDGILDLFPWKDYREDITTLFVDNDLTLVSRNSFADMHNLSVIEIPSTVKTIEENAFYGDTAISEIHYQGSESEWNNVVIESGNEALATASVICNYNAGWREAQGPKLFQSIDYINNKIRIDGKEYYYSGCMLNDNSVTQQKSRYVYYKIDDDGIVYALYKKKYTRPKKEDSNLIVVPGDIWAQSNYGVPGGIPLSYYDAMSNPFWKLIHRAVSSEKNGLCFGLCLSDYLFAKEILSVNDLYYVDPETGDVKLCDVLRDADKNYKIAGLKKDGAEITVEDLWYYAFIYQKDDDCFNNKEQNIVKKDKNSENNIYSDRYNSILASIKNEIDTNGACMIQVYGDFDHAILAIGYEGDIETTGEFRLKIYDSNYGHERGKYDEKLYITFKLNDGNAYYWSYDMQAKSMNSSTEDISYLSFNIVQDFLPWLARAGVTYDVNEVPPKKDTARNMISISGGSTKMVVAGTSVNLEDIYGSSNGAIIPIYEDEDGNLIAWFDGDNISVEAENGVEFSIVTGSYELVNQLPAGSSMTYTATPTTEEQTGYTVSIVNPTNEEVVVTFNGQDNTTSTITVPANEELQCTGNGESIEEVKPEPKYFSEWVDGKWYDKDGSQTYPYTLSWKSNKKGKWVVDTKGWYPKNQWQKIDGVTYFFKADGYMASGEWCKNYWINTDGSCSNTKATWKKDKNGYWFGNSGWYAKNQWQMIDGKWYYFKADGYMASNEWCKGYWLNKDGSYTYAGKASWKKDKIGWYYSDNKGWYAKKQWQKIDGKWYYFDAKGYITTGTKTIGGKTYRFNSSGVCLNP